MMITKSAWIGAALTLALSLTGAVAEERGALTSEFTCRDPGAAAERTSVAGGQDATVEQFPFIVELIAGDNGCGGVLIAPGFVLTAAHCVMPYDFTRGCPGGLCPVLPPEQIRVTRPDGRGLAAGESAGATHVFAHPDFSYAPAAGGEPALDADIAIIRLDRPLEAPDGAYASLADPNFDARFARGGECAQAAGWGLTDVLDDRNRIIVAGPRTPVLQGINLELVSRAECEGRYGRRISDAMLCAGDGVEGRNTCKGDSGGPLIVDVGGPVLVGVVSWAIGCAQADHYTIFTRVGAPRVRGWIEETILGPR